MALFEEKNEQEIFYKSSSEIIPYCIKEDFIDQDNFDIDIMEIYAVKIK